MAVPRRILVVCIATGAKMVRVSGTEGVCIIQTCRMPEASAATMVETAVDAFAPFTTSPTRSRVGFDEDSCTPDDVVSLFCIRQISFKIVVVFSLNIALRVLHRQVLLVSLDIARERGYTVYVVNSNQRRSFMIDTLATVCIFVIDQDRAKAFYIDKL